MHRAQEEIGFWERFIRDWERDRGEPAPPRMYRALELARVRLAYYRAMDVAGCA